MKFKKALMKRLVVNRQNGCWEIQGYLDKDGYGEVSRKKAHRLPMSYSLGRYRLIFWYVDFCFGERNTQNKLTEQQVLEIYRSSETQRKIALKYNIDQSNVSHIKTGKLWGWLTRGGEAS